MKKNLFYVFALICSMSLFTACSDDDDETWKEIPTEEIDVASGNATVNINGTTSTTGSVKMTVKNESEATMALQNVIPGYADLNIDVELQKQADNSFKYAGTAKVNTAPSTREFSSDPAILTVEVDGTITLDGKVTVNVTASGPGLLVGTYTGAQLSLKYSDVELAGKTVYYTVTNSVPVLTLANIVPGETTTAISGVYPDDKGAFSGEVTTETGTKVAYSGTLTAASGMTLNVDVTLSATAQGGLTATWPLSHTLLEGDTYGISEHSPVRIVWGVDASSPFLPDYLCYVLPALTSAPLAEVLNNISFSADGNLTASYYSGIMPYYKEGDKWIKVEAIEDFMGMQLPVEASWVMTVGMGMLPINPYDREWKSSPKNLLHWYAKDGYIYLIPNIGQILKQLVADKSIDEATLNQINGVLAILPNLEEMDDATLQNLAQSALGTILKQLVGTDVDLSGLNAGLIRQVLGWLTNGIPMKYKAEAGSLYLYVDKDMAEPFMKLLIPLIPTLEAQLGQIMPEKFSLSMLLQMFFQIDSLTVLGDIWNNYTTAFELGINFLTTNE